MNNVLDGIEIDENIIESLKERIVLEEKNNLRTKKYSKGKMIEMICKMIKEEISC